MKVAENLLAGFLDSDRMKTRALSIAVLGAMRSRDSSTRGDDHGARGDGAGAAVSRQRCGGRTAGERQAGSVVDGAPLQAGDRSIEVLANPLNEVNQLRAGRAMAQIENNIQAAQRRAELEYDHAVTEAKRTGQSQEVDGIALSDEGVAGARIDAESHVTIDVVDQPARVTFEHHSSFNRRRRRRSSIPGAVAVIAVPSNAYRAGHEPRAIREAQTMVFLGRVAAPVQKRADSHSR